MTGTDTHKPSTFRHLSDAEDENLFVRDTLSGQDREAILYDAILGAYITGRLPPGTRLPEHQVAEIFDVSRERARKVLHQLAHERWLDLAPRRGVIVPKATMVDAVDIVQARIVVESGVLEQLIAEPRLVDKHRLYSHLQKEKQAESNGNVLRLTQLTAEFHSIIAGFLRNNWILQHLNELVLRSLVFISLYGHGVSHNFCGHSDHETIVEHLVGRDILAAKTAMISHIKGMSSLLDFHTERKLSQPLSQIFQDYRKVP